MQKAAAHGWRFITNWYPRLFTDRDEFVEAFFFFNTVFFQIIIAAFLRVMLCVTNAVEFTTFYADKITVADTI